MNEVLTKENKRFREKYYYTELENGFKITVVPKDLPMKSAFLCCNFGGADVEYTLDGKSYSLPYGTAHFLEHKMFETAEGGDAFLEFDAHGGNANAYTSYENTCYYFSCAENLFENLRVLLGAVASFHCTEKSVKKERGIIAREIKMYDDLPDSNLSRNLARALYKSHPSVMAISGTVESIGEIDKKTLYRAYEHFYVPSNLSLCVCADVDINELATLAREYFGALSHERPNTIFRQEPSEVNTRTLTESAIVATPLFSIGIKCPSVDLKNIETVRQTSAMRVAISLIFGRASDFYCENYSLGLLSERFFAGYTTSRGAAHIIITGTSENCELVLEKAIAEIEYRKTHFFTDEQVNREKKAAYAECLTLFDNGEDLANSYAVGAFYNYDEFDCMEILRDITPEEIKTALCSINTENSAISIIKKG